MLTFKAEVGTFSLEVFTVASKVFTVFVFLNIPKAYASAGKQGSTDVRVVGSQCTNHQWPMYESICG